MFPVELKEPEAQPAALEGVMGEFSMELPLGGEARSLRPSRGMEREERFERGLQSICVLDKAISQLVLSGELSFLPTHELAKV
jgi:hypothetical protein